jgi:hypothetical protein
MKPEILAELQQIEQMVIGAARSADFRITTGGEDAAGPTTEVQARHAYAVCRDLSLTQLAWSHHTAATEEAITEALAAAAHDPERVRRACRLGIGDRGKPIVEARDV